MERIDDHQETIDSYAGQRQSANVHADALGVWYQMAESIPKYPAAQERVERGERHGQHTQQHVAEREIRDEQIRDSVHLPIAPDDEHHQRVPEDAQEENAHVERAEDELHRPVRRHVL